MQGTLAKLERRKGVPRNTFPVNYSPYVHGNSRGKCNHLASPKPTASRSTRLEPSSNAGMPTMYVSDQGDEENFYENFKIEVEENNAYVQEAKRAVVLHSDTQVTNITSSKRTLFLTNSRRSIRDLQNKVTNLLPCLPRTSCPGPPPPQPPAGPQPPCWPI